MVVSESESISIVGGATGFTAALISAATRVVSTIYSFGQNFGTAIYRIIHKVHC